MLEKLTSPLSNEELKSAFSEMEEWQKSGVLNEGIVRKVHREYIEMVGYDDPTHLRVVEKALLYEMALRFANDL